MDVRIPFWHMIPSSSIVWHDFGGVRSRPTTVNLKDVTLHTKMCGLPSKVNGK